MARVSFFADWLITIEPIMTDMSDTSHERWTLLLKEAKEWYDHYVRLRPLQRSSCVVECSKELMRAKWSRVQKMGWGRR